MEIWFTFAILSALFFGLNQFIKKIIANKYLEKNHFLLYSTMIQTFLTFIYFVYNGSYFYMTFLFLFLIIIRMILATEKNSTMIESLKYIDSSLFFPIHDLIKIGGGFVVGMTLFGEYLSSREIIFLVFGIFSTLLLGYKKGKGKNKDFMKGIILMIISSLLLVGTSTINKYMGESHDIALYMFICNIIGIIYILTKMKLGKIKFHFNKLEIIYGNIYGLFGTLGFLFLLYSLKDGKLVIIQLIGTIAVFIPIVLSYLFLKEEVNRYRLLGLVLFLGNLGLFYLNK